MGYGTPGDRDCRTREWADYSKDPLQASYITSLASLPDGQRLYWTAGGRVWSASVSDGEPQRVTAGDAIAMDPEGKYLVVQVIQRPGARLIRVPLNGSPQQQQEISFSGSFHLTPYPITSGAITS